MCCLEQLEGRRLFASYTAATVAELINAINVANTSPQADSITLGSGATFSLAAVNNTANGATGLPEIAATGGGLTIVGNGDIIERSSTAGTPDFRLFDVAAGASLALQNLTLQGGFAFSRGGAVYNQGTLSLQNVIVQNSTAQGFGGSGYYNLPGGDAAGGGIYSTGVLILQGSTIQNNLAIGGRGGDGGFIPRSMPGSSHPRRYDATDGGNGFGAGLYVGGGTATIRNSTITANTAKGGDGGGGTSAGGGIYINTSASVGLDAFTVKHVTRNAASSFKDIFGSYALIV